MPYEPDAVERIFNRRMKDLRQRNCLPTELLDLVARVFEAQAEARRTAEVVLPPESDLAPADQRAQGAPLLVRDRFPFDRAQARALVGRFLDLLESLGEPIGPAAKAVREALEKSRGDDGSLDLDAAFDQYLEGSTELVDQWAQKTPDAPRTLGFLVQSAMAPSLAAASEAMTDAPDEPEKVEIWRHGHCPVCGSLPLLGELREKEGFKFMTCSFCSHAYRVPRLSCVFCGEDEAERLAFFSADDEPGYRVEVCKSCSRYVKVADFRNLDRQTMPLLDDLESLALDILAAREGYARPTLSGLGF